MRVAAGGILGGDPVSPYAYSVGNIFTSGIIYPNFPAQDIWTRRYILKLTRSDGEDGKLALAHAGDSLVPTLNMKQIKV